MSGNIFGYRIRMTRFMKNPPMSQKELLIKLQNKGIDISQSTLSKIENGNRYITDTELVALADILNVDISWLLKESGRGL